MSPARAMEQHAYDRAHLLKHETLLLTHKTPTLNAQYADRLSKTPNTGTIRPTGTGPVWVSAACIDRRAIPRCGRLLRPCHLAVMLAMSNDTAQRPLGLDQLAVLFLEGCVIITANSYLVLLLYV